MRIYVVGIVASGKTTLSKSLSQCLNLPMYELDVIVHPVIDNERIKRTAEEQVEYIKNLNGPWLIEGTLRTSCMILLDLADVIVFVDPPLMLRKKRILTRFIKQRLGIEKCHYKSTFRMLKMMYHWTGEFENKRDDFEYLLSEYSTKLIRVGRDRSEDNVKEIMNELAKKDKRV